jgi:RimJ/RimL family protein N-acetyltransferase
VTLRHADEADLRFISGLAADPAVEPFLMPGAAESGRLQELLHQAPLGLFVIEVGDGEPAGVLALEVVSERSRICQLSRLMVDPGKRGVGIATEAVRQASRLALMDLGLHRLQAEVYGDNASSTRLFERVGFTPEGVRRQAYWRRGQWLDGVLYGLLADDLPREGYGAAHPGRADQR